MILASGVRIQHFGWATVAQSQVFGLCYASKKGPGPKPLLLGPSPWLSDPSSAIATDVDDWLIASPATVM